MRAVDVLVFGLFSLWLAEDVLSGAVEDVNHAPEKEARNAKKKKITFGENENDAMSYILERNEKPGKEKDIVPLVEGDIYIPRLEGSYRYKEGGEPPFADFRERDTSRLWRDGVVPYVIDSKFKKKTKKHIKEAIDHFHERTCIRFVKRKKEADYLLIKRSTKCWSGIGRLGGEQVIALDESACIHLGTIIHELLHTLGLYHEQSRTDRDMYVNIKWNNIEPGKFSQFERTYRHEYTDPLGATYDYWSIMHYHSKAFSRNGEDTIVPKMMPDVNIMQRNYFSPLDLYKINSLYECGMTGLEDKLLPGTGECYVAKNGADYRGTVSKTKSGRDCQSWASQTPHEHKYTDPYDVARHGLGDHNHCRNPDGRSKAWCYTTDRRKKLETCKIGKPKEHCAVTGAGAPPRPTPQIPSGIVIDDEANECYVDERAIDYRGSVTMTRDGSLCQKWTDQYPIPHHYTPENYPYKGLGDHSYCRNPNGDERGAWCVIATPYFNTRGFISNIRGYCDVGEPATLCNDTAGCGVEFNFHRPGGDMNDGEERVLNRDECCSLCRTTPGCIAWTFDKRPGRSFGKCWLKDTILDGMGDDCCDSGILEDELGCFPQENKTAPGLMTTSSDGNNVERYKVATPLACCNACWQSRHCLSWTFDKSEGANQDVNCWLRSSIDSTELVEDDCCVSGFLGQARVN